MTALRRACARWSILAGAMRIVLNGKPTEIETGATVATLVERVARDARMVAVEVNLALVRRKDHATTSLADGDAVEVVTLVGGG